MAKMLGVTGYWRRCSCMDCGSRNRRRMRARDKVAGKAEIRAYLDEVTGGNRIVSGKSGMQDQSRPDTRGGHSRMQIGPARSMITITESER